MKTIVKEKPILFNPEMVRAVLSGKKTQTRRIMMPQPEHRENDAVKGSYGTFFHGWNLDHKCVSVSDFIKYCPYGQIGQEIWVRETHYLYGFWNKKSEKTKTGKQKYEFIDDKEYGVKFLDKPPANIQTKRSGLGWFKRPSIFIPRWASRIQLKITDIRVERVQDISESDARNEGITYSAGGQSKEFMERNSPINCFKYLWDSINEKRGYSWKSNPFVWIVEFDIEKGGITLKEVEKPKAAKTTPE